MTTFAWLGTGLLGSGFVEAALSRGDTVHVWNRTFAKAEALTAHGAKAFRTVAEAVSGVSRVHLCLSDDASVEAVLAELLPVLGEGIPIVDHTTVSPAGGVARARRLEDLHVGFLACPVFMAPANAKAAQGRMLCAGPSALVERLAPELRKMTGELVLLGEDVKKPYGIKLFGNALIVGVTAALVDAATVGLSSDLTTEEMESFMASFPVGNVLAGRGKKILAGDYSASFELTMARKDVRLMIEASGDKPLSALPGIASRMDRLIGEGHGQKDFGVIGIGTIAERNSTASSSEKR
jgi:3-hydroxyisobutyrate dehydrogenase-like beta-hydroxyacid dehydrogenase